MPGDHPLRKERIIKGHSLMHEPFILASRSGVFFEPIRAFCHRSGFEPRVVQEANEIQTVVGLVSAGMGISLVPTSTQRVQMPNVAYRPVALPPVAETLLAWRKGQYSPIIEAFTATAKKALRVPRDRASRTARPSRQ
jgi:DNA-binding transcriptional LysR family regulator